MTKFDALTQVHNCTLSLMNWDKRILGFVNNGKHHIQVNLKMPKQPVVQKHDISD